jgi:hypothetical protein
MAHISQKRMNAQIKEGKKGENQPGNGERVHTKAKNQRNEANNAGMD